MIGAAAALHAALGVPGVQALTTLRHGAGQSVAPFDHFNLGNHRAATGDRPEAVEANRALTVPVFGLPAAPRWLRQVHGTQVVRLGNVPSQGEPEADAAVTSDPGVVLAILTADCLPVVFAARDGREIGAAHAGWRGLADGVLEATVAAMRTPADRMVAWLGPAAGPQAYEVGQDVREAFIGGDAGAQGAFMPTRPGHWHVDLYALARRRLAAVGVREVLGGGRCTITEVDRYFSHRRDARTGRMATLAWMQP
jgi:YfiH family protein